MDAPSSRGISSRSARGLQFRRSTLLAPAGRCPAAPDAGDIRGPANSNEPARSQAAYAYRNRNGTFEALDTLVVTHGASVYKFVAVFLAQRHPNVLHQRAGGRFVHLSIHWPPSSVIPTADPGHRRTFRRPAFAPYNGTTPTHKLSVFRPSLKLAPRLTFNYGCSLRIFWSALEHRARIKKID